MCCLIPIRGVYLATVFYQKDNILVTAEDQIPLVEIQCCSTSITHDFLWFAKVSCHPYTGTEMLFVSMQVFGSFEAMDHNEGCWGVCVNKVAFLFLLQLSCAWQQVPWLQQALASAQFSSSSLLQNRHNILRAVSLLQVRSHAAYSVQKEVTDWIVPSPFLSCVWLLPFVESTLVPVFYPSPFLWPQTSLGIMDLGQVYYEPLKDRQGNILLVTLKDFLTTSRWGKFIVLS